MLQPEYIGEFLGTLFLMIFGLGVVANVLLHKSKGKDAGWLCITTGWAMGVLIGVFTAQAAGSIEADINPAVTLAKYLMGTAYLSWTEVLTVISFEIAGAFVGAVIVWLIYYPHWEATFDTDLKRAVYCTSPAIRHWPSNLMSETLATTVLILGIGAIVSMAEKATAPAGLVPYLIAMLVWGIGISLGGPTGYAINPARDLGPRLAHAVLPIGRKGNSDWAYAWIPVVGPLVGGALGALLWTVFF